MQNGEYLNIADFTTKEQPKNADNCVFDLREDIRLANCDVRWRFELPNDEAYKKNPNLKFDLHRTGEPMFAFPGCIGVAVLFFSNTAHSDPFLREHRQMYLDGYLSGWNDFQSYSERSGRFGLQPIQDRKRALFNLFVEYRTKHIGKGFQATLLRQMGYDAGFMFALAQELYDIDKITPVSQEFPPKDPIISKLDDFIIKDREKVLRFIETELRPCRAKQGKLIAMIIVVLRDCGYFVQTDGKLTQIHNAFCEKYPGKIGRLTGIVDYINSHDNPEYDGDKQIREDELKLLQSKLENFVE